MFTVVSRDANGTLTALRAIVVCNARAQMHAHVLATKAVVTDARCALARVGMLDKVGLANAREVYENI